jgi:hypothetical protein
VIKVQAGQRLTSVIVGNGGQRRNVLHHGLGVAAGATTPRRAILIAPTRVGMRHKSAVCQNNPLLLDQFSGTYTAGWEGNRGSTDYDSAQPWKTSRWGFCCTAEMKSTNCH